ncbi:unnamed protein product [Nyctereutes procyonoides]|uniref:(raccoon dog) hypothetical protein n=1 Tax=Nyctereutes procyonoides TaxID=34880 RepID=A0A811ZQA9_NYCPR|nr:unnamed protein product [Nyctereutes procyonoides]
MSGSWCMEPVSPSACLCLSLCVPKRSIMAKKTQFHSNLNNPFPDHSMWSAPHDKTLMDKELLLMDEQRKQFVEMKYISGEDAVKIVEMTTKDVECYINLVDKNSSRV